jgi:adenylate cyclase
MFSLTSLLIADLHDAMQATRPGDPDTAIGLADDTRRPVPARRLDLECASHPDHGRGVATATGRWRPALRTAAAQRLAGVPSDPGFVVNEITVMRLRALTAHAAGDDIEYREYRNRYRNMARSVEFEGHIGWAETTP